MIYREFMIRKEGLTENWEVIYHIKDVVWRFCGFYVRLEFQVLFDPSWHKENNVDCIRGIMITLDAGW